MQASQPWSLSSFAASARTPQPQTPPHTHQHLKWPRTRPQVMATPMPANSHMPQMAPTTADRLHTVDRKWAPHKLVTTTLHQPQRQVLISAPSKRASKVNLTSLKPMAAPNTALLPHKHTAAQRRATLVVTVPPREPTIWLIPKVNTQLRSPPTQLVERQKCQEVLLWLHTHHKLAHLLLRMCTR